jgi:hypothetical protein
MRLPNAADARVDLEKLLEYGLNDEHPPGKYKAHVFAGALGLTTDRAEELREALLHSAQDCDAEATEQDQYGQRYRLDFGMEGITGQVTVRSLWIVRTGEDFPRLVSCFVL